jgi:TolA-binding protein
MKYVLTLTAISTLALGGTIEPRSAAQGAEDLAKRQYESGRTFVQNGRYVEGLKDFQAVVDSFPQSAVADDALLDIALYQMDVAGDHQEARAAADRLLKDYPASDSAPMAYVLVGRLAMATSHAPAAIDTALASFERVSRLFPTSSAVPAARFYTGDTLRLARRTDEALEHFRRLSVEYPRSIWAARAGLAAAANLVATDRATQAFGRLQRIRQQFPGTPEATAALNFNTILYRLYLRKPAPYSFGGRFIGSEKDRFRDVIGMAVDDTGRVFLGHRQGVTIFDSKGTLVRTSPAMEPSAFFLDGRDRVVVTRGALLVPEKGAPISMIVPSPGRDPREVGEIPAVIVLSNGDRLIADRRGRAVIRVSPEGKFLANFASVNAERLARNTLDEVAMIDRDSKAVVIVDRDGKTLAKVASKGTGYQFEDPADLAYDALGHLYVLDSRRAAIHVFGPKGRLIATVSSTGKEPGALQRPRAIALDPAGRLYVFDESSHRIQVYQ